MGILDGFFPWGVMQALGKGSVFAWGQALSARAMKQSTLLTKEQQVVVSGGFGG